MTNKPAMLDWADFPDDFAKFELDPTGCELSIEELGTGVYALMSSLYNVDNAGFIVGDKGVLVIDAHICTAMGAQIQTRVREVTAKPILYLGQRQLSRRPHIRELRLSRRDTAHPATRDGVALAMDRRGKSVSVADDRR